MRKYLIAVAAALLAVVGLAAPAQATEWSANGDSYVVDATTVHLEGANTSVETGDINLVVDAGTEVTFRYELHDGAECTGGAPRVFLIVDGTNVNSWDGNDGQCGTDGLVTFTIPNAGGIGWAGVVYDNGAGGYVRVSDLTIGGEKVLFAAVSDEDDDEGDEDGNEDNGQDNGADNSGSETENGDSDQGGSTGADGQDNGHTPVPTAVPAGVGTLPETGPGGTALVLLGLLGAVLVFGGSALVIRNRNHVRPGRYRA